ncbi:YfiR family protein [endosymbiont of Lamellibrachia barhami]|uniref:YfiR family protein n=1 Tax=endosymbiont of Lamellibrachia barhami TaxID=205975 RepID=UPI001FEAC63D|nr:YfiR family protein [endosymbiont of Lamellibrachia barhami]
MTYMPSRRFWQRLCILLLVISWSAPAWSEKIPEYRMKAAFLYNFATFTEWPSNGHDTFSFCIYGEDPFGDHLDLVKGKLIGDRPITVRQAKNSDALNDCQLVFISRSAKRKLQQVHDAVKGKPVLTVSDIPDAVHKGVILNMDMRKGRVTFEINLSAARGNGLNLNSKLLRLAKEVIQ